MGLIGDLYSGSTPRRPPGLANAEYEMPEDRRYRLAREAQAAGRAATEYEQSTLREFVPPTDRDSTFGPEWEQDVNLQEAARRLATNPHLKTRAETLAKLDEMTTPQDRVDKLLGRRTTVTIPPEKGKEDIVEGYDDLIANGKVYRVPRYETRGPTAKVASGVASVITAPFKAIGKGAEAIGETVRYYAGKQDEEKPLDANEKGLSTAERLRRMRFNLEVAAQGGTIPQQIGQTIEQASMFAPMAGLGEAATVGSALRQVGAVTAPTVVPPIIRQAKGEASESTPEQGRKTGLAGVVQDVTSPQTAGDILAAALAGKDIYHGGKEVGRLANESVARNFQDTRVPVEKLSPEEMQAALAQSDLAGLPPGVEPAFTSGRPAVARGPLEPPVPPLTKEPPKVVPPEPGPTPEQQFEQQVERAAAPLAIREMVRRVEDGRGPLTPEEATRLLEYAQQTRPAAGAPTEPSAAAVERPAPASSSETGMAPPAPPPPAEPAAPPGFREVRPGEILEPGARVEMNVSTGKSYVHETPPAAPAEPAAPVTPKPPLVVPPEVRPVAPAPEPVEPSRIAPEPHLSVLERARAAAQAQVEPPRGSTRASGVSPEGPGSTPGGAAPAKPLAGLDVVPEAVRAKLAARFNGTRPSDVARQMAAERAREMAGEPKPTPSEIRRAEEAARKGTVTPAAPPAPAWSPAAVEAAYRKTETSPKQGSWDASVVDRTASRVVRPLAQALDAGEWRTAADLAKSAKVATTRTAADHLRWLKERGLAQTAWDSEGEPHYAKPGVPLPEWLSTGDTPPPPRPKGGTPKPPLSDYARENKQAAADFLDYQAGRAAKRGNADTAATLAARRDELRAELGKPATALSRVQAAARAAAAPITETGARQPLYDSEQRRYDYRPATVDVDALDVSERPGDFQSRDLTSQAERTKIGDIARKLDRERLAQMGPSPAEGAPVVWRDPETGRTHVVAGNGRVLAMREAGVEGQVPVRVLEGDRAGAVRLAAASQRSASAPESPIAAARAAVKSLALTPEDAPRHVPGEPITRDNVADFVKKNPAFATKLNLPNYPDAAAARVNQAIVGLLPESTQRVAEAVGAKVEQAIAAAAPVLLDLRRRAAAGEIRPEFDILGRFERAARAFENVAGRRTTGRKLVEDLSRAAEQPGLFGKTAAQEIDQADAGLLLGLASMEGRANPGEAMAAALTKLRDTALEPGNSPRQGGLFGAATPAEPLDVVRTVFGDRVAEQAARFRPSGGAAGGPPGAPGAKQAAAPSSPERGATNIFDPSEYAAAAKRLAATFEPPKPYESALPADVQAPQQALEGAKPPQRTIGERLKERAATSYAKIMDFADIFSGVRKEPGIGLATKDGKPLSLQVDMKVLAKRLIATDEIATEEASAFQDAAKSPENLALATRVVILRDLDRMARENDALAVAKTQAEDTIARLQSVKARRENRTLSQEEQTELDAARKTLRQQPKALSGHTEATIRQNLAEAERHLATSPDAQKAVGEVRRILDETADDMKAVKPEAKGLEDYFPHEVIFDTDAARGKGGPTPAVKRPYVRSAQHRGGTERLFNPDVAEVLYRHVREWKRAREINDFAKKLQGSENNLVPYVTEHGALPEGLKPEDVAFWSFERGAPTVTGVPVERALTQFVDDAQATTGLRAALESGDTAGAKEILQRYSQGRMRPYMLVKRNVAEALDGLRMPPVQYGLGQAAIDLAHSLFRATALTPRGWLSYLERNFFGDVMNFLQLGSKTAEIPRNVAGTVAKVPEFIARRAAEVARGAPDPVLNEARELQAMQSGLFGSAGSVRRRGVLNRIMTGKEGPRQPFANLPPGWKAVRGLEEGAMAPIRAAVEARIALEAAPRMQAIQSLVREGYNKDAATVLGNQIIVDYSLLSRNASAARRLLSPFLAWTLQTSSNYLRFPVRSAASTLTKMAVLYGAVNLWNWMVTPDLEKRLPPEKQADPHLNIGKAPDGRTVSIRLSQVGVDLPAPYKAAAAGILKGVSKLVKSEETARDIERVARGYGKHAREDVTGLAGPVPSGAYALYSGQDFRTGEELEPDWLKRLPPDERAKVNSLKYGVPEAIAANTRWARALSPWFGPIASFEQVTQEDLQRAGERRAQLLGDPRTYTEPGSRTYALRKDEKDEALDRLWAAGVAGDARAAAAARAHLVELRVSHTDVARFMTERRKEMQRQQQTPEQRRAAFQRRNAPIEPQ